MEKVEFKEKYFTNSFYWVSQDTYKKIQKIGIEFGCVNPNGDKSIINWHEGFNNIGFRTRNGITKFQKEPFLLHNEKAVDYSQMIKDYKNL